MVTVLPLKPLWVMLTLLQIQSRSVPRAEGLEQEHVSEARGGVSSAHTWAQRLPAHWGHTYLPVRSPRQSPRVLHAASLTGVYTVSPPTLNPGQPDPFQSVHTQNSAQVLKISQMNTKYYEGEGGPLNLSITQLTGTVNSEFCLWKTPTAKTSGVRENKHLPHKTKAP